MGSVDGNGSPLITKRDQPHRLAWFVPVGLAVAIALYNLVLCPMHGRGDSRDWETVLGIGIIFVQPLLLAAWAAMGPGSLFYRLPISAATLVAWIFAQSSAEWNVLALEMATNELNVEMAVAFLVTFAVASAVLGLVRRATGIRVSLHDASSPASENRPQFGMKYLLGWMTVCALLIIVGRSFIPGSVWPGAPWLVRIWEVCLAIAFLLLLLTPPAVLLLLVLVRPTPWRWLLIVGLVSPVSLWAAVQVMNLNSSPRPSPDSYGLFAGVQLGATAAAVACATVLRLAGFQVTNTVVESPRPPSAASAR